MNRTLQKREVKYMADEEEDTLTNLTPAEPVVESFAPGDATASATMPTAQANVADAIVPDPTREWGPPSTARYLAALVIVLGISAAGAFVVWYFWGKQIWGTITGDWT